MVDDDPQTLRYVRDALAAAGFVPLVTGDPRELAYLLQTHRPQLVLLDLRLPGADGIELLEHVHELADLPVIFLSGYGRDETMARALDLGAADYIVKPFSPTELTARVRAALRRRAETEPFVLDDLVFHYEQRRVQVGGPAGAVDGHGVRLAPRALGQRGTGADQRGPAPAGVGRAGRGRRLHQGPALGEPTTSHGVRGPRGRDFGSSSCDYVPQGTSDHDAFDLVERDRVRRPVVELRRLRRRVPGDPLRVLERPAVRQVRRDARRPKRVAARRRRQPRRRRPPLDHRQDGAARQRPPAQPARSTL